MENEQEQKNQEETNKPIEPPVLANDEAINAIPETTQNSQDTEKSTSIQDEPEKIIVIKEESNSNQPLIANIIAAIGVLVSIVMFIYTYLLFTETQKSTKAAIKSADAAELAVMEQIKNDSINKINESIKSRNDSVNTYKRFQLDSASIQAQIDYFNEIKKQFEIENRPFVQLGDFKLNPFQRVNNQIVFPIKFRVVNFGKLPAQILEVNYDNFFMGDKDAIDSVDAYNIKYKTNYNVTIGNVADGGMEIDATIIIEEDWVYDKIQKGEWNYFLFGNIKYICPTTKKFYLYKFIYRIQLNNMDITILRNVDIETKK